MEFLSYSGSELDYRKAEYRYSIDSHRNQLGTAKERPIQSGGYMIFPSLAPKAPVERHREETRPSRGCQKDPESFVRSGSIPLLEKQSS
jgi:hypothetical protein